MDPLVGIMLGNRYEILEKIGEGGMALVYKAKCHLLNRFVAIKILRTEFAMDDDFVHKFNKESQASASLSHPSIVNIYDVGQQDNLHYIVMEYVNGTTLKQHLRNLGGRLGEYEMVSISKQIAEALDHAHKNHIIHRDIKPHNILINDSGRVKVADFGIARAITSSTITNTAEIIGSVHYISPEQARGGFVDERSDIYSLGVLMYEIACNKVPYEGDNHVTIAIRHMKEEPVPPSVINPSVAKGFESIILRAMQKSPTNRFQSASDMVSDLNRLIMNPNIAFDYAFNSEDSPTMVMPKIAELEESMSLEHTNLIPDFMRGASETAGVSSGHHPNSEAQLDRIEQVMELSSLEDGTAGRSEYGKAQASTLGNDSRLDSSRESTRDTGRNSRKKGSKKGASGPTDKKSLVISAVAGVVLSLLVIFFGFKFILGGGSVVAKTVEVPDIEKINVTVAEQKLRDAGLKIQVKGEEVSEDVPVDFIIRQEPAAGSKIKEGEMVAVYVSKGGDGLVMPNLTNKTFDEAKIMLGNVNLKIDTVEYMASDAPRGVVVEQIPAGGTNVGADVKVTVKLSEGKNGANILMPDLAGKNINDAEDMLKGLKLTRGAITFNYSDTYAENAVMLQSVASGTRVEENTSVDVVVSKGKDPAATGTTPGNTTGTPGTGTTTPKAGEKSYKLNLVYPAGVDSLDVKVTKTVGGIEEVVVEKTYKKPETSAVVKVPISGPTTVKIYINGEPIITKEENF